MKFRFYITNTFDGIIQGTDDETKANEFSGCSEYFVVDTSTGEWLMEDGERQFIEAVP